LCDDPRSPDQQRILEHILRILGLRAEALPRHRTPSLKLWRNRPERFGGVRPRLELVAGAPVVGGDFLLG
jgi:hypothetical protein